MILLLVVFHPLWWQMSKAEPKLTHTHAYTQTKGVWEKKEPDRIHWERICAWVHSTNWASFCGARILLFVCVCVCDISCGFWLGSAHIISSFVINTLCQFCFSAGSFRFRMTTIVVLCFHRNSFNVRLTKKKRLYAHLIV